jgi:hypothetical protein
MSAIEMPDVPDYRAPYYCAKIYPVLTIHPDRELEIRILIGIRPSIKHGEPICRATHLALQLRHEVLVR